MLFDMDRLIDSSIFILTCSHWKKKKLISYNQEEINPTNFPETLLQSLPPATKLGQGNIFRSVCQEFCPQGDMHGSGACMAGAGHAWQGACMVGGGVHGIRSMNGRYASYWNAFLFTNECLQQGTHAVGLLLSWRIVQNQSHRRREQMQSNWYRCNEFMTWISWIFIKSQLFGRLICVAFNILVFS